MDSKLDHERRMTKALNPLRLIVLQSRTKYSAMRSIRSTNEIFSDAMETARTRYFGTQRNSHTTDEIFRDPRFVRRNKRDISRRDTVRETQSDEKISRDAI